MRDHSSHDILLMCHNCHTHSNLLDLNLRRELALECDAPIGTEDDIKVCATPREQNQNFELCSCRSPHFAAR